MTPFYKHKKATAIVIAVIIVLIINKYERNFAIISRLVIDEIPKMLRQLIIRKWDEMVDNLSKENKSNWVYFDGKKEQKIQIQK